MQLWEFINDITTLCVFFNVTLFSLCFTLLRKNVKSNIETVIGNNQSSRVVKIQNCLARSQLLLSIVMSILTVNWNKTSPTVEGVCLLCTGSDIFMRYSENIVYENFESCLISFRLVEHCQFYCVSDTPVDKSAQSLLWGDLTRSSRYKKLVQRHLHTPSQSPWERNLLLRNRSLLVAVYGTILKYVRPAKPY